MDPSLTRGAARVGAPSRHEAVRLRQSASTDVAPARAVTAAVAPDAHPRVNAGAADPLAPAFDPVGRAALAEAGDEEARRRRSPRQALLRMRAYAAPCPDAPTPGHPLADI